MNRRDCSGFPSQQNSTCWGAKSLDHSHHSKGGFHMVPRPGPTRPDRCWTRSREESSEIRDPQKYTPKTNLQLVGGPGEKALWKMMEFVNWDDDIPNIYIYIYVYIYIWENIKNGNQTTTQTLPTSHYERHITQHQLIPLVAETSILLPRLHGFTIWQNRLNVVKPW